MVLTYPHGAFQSTLPARGATSQIRSRFRRMYISIHAPRTGSDQHGHKGYNCRPISIHAPRTGSDDSPKNRYHSNPLDFNPRSPHGERHNGRLLYAAEHLHFNPRSPHGERPTFQRGDTGFQHFNPRSPHGERRFRDGSHLSAWGISIHAPRTGSDCRCRQIPCQHTISIHAPRTGSDAPTSVISGEHRNFNPRSPHGERPSVRAMRLLP